MGFIRTLLRLPIWFLATGLLVACSVAPQQPPTAEPGANTEPDVAADDFERIPDPYLAQQKTASPEAQTLFADAQQAMQAQQWQQAQVLLQQMIERYPSLSGPYINLGLVFREQGQVEAAADAFRQAATANPHSSDAHNQLAVLYREQGEFAEAEQAYLKALKVWPHNPVVHRNLGILYDLYMGRFADALHHYQMSQKVSDEPERRVEGWIVDLQRRMAERQASAKQEESNGE